MIFRFPAAVFAPEGAPSPPPGDPPVPPGGDPASSPAKMPDGLPAQFWDQQSGAVNLPDFIKSYGELSTFKTQHDERIAALPKTPDDYALPEKIALPEGVKLPDGVSADDLKVDAKDPRLAPARAFLHKYQLPPDALHDLVVLDALDQIRGIEEADADIQKNMKSLGDNGPARVKAVQDFLQANISKEECAALRLVIADATAFAGMEKLIAKATTQQIPGVQRDAGAPPPPKPRLADVLYPNSGQQKAS